MTEEKAKCIRCGMIEVEFLKGEKQGILCDLKIDNGAHLFEAALFHEVKIAAEEHFISPFWSPRRKKKMLDFWIPKLTQVYEAGKREERANAFNAGLQTRTFDKDAYAFKDGVSFERSRIKKAVEGMKKYSGKHNASHTWIDTGYCHGCKEILTQIQLEEEFGYNVALTDILTLLTPDEKV